MKRLMSVPRLGRNQSRSSPGWGRVAALRNLEKMGVTWTIPSVWSQCSKDHWFFASFGGYVGVVSCSILSPCNLSVIRELGSR